jgi:NAD(P) transhydrogenase subunit beta
LGSVICLIIGLRRLSSPDTARSGNFIAATGMIVAILTTLFVPLDEGDDNYLLIVIAIAIGTILGLLLSKRVQMTAMPELVSLFNGLGGACAVTISLIELIHYQEYFTVGSFTEISIGKHLTTLLAMFIGGIAFTGSMLAYAKLACKVKDFTIRFAFFINLFLLLSTIILVTTRVMAPDASFLIPIGVLSISLIYGFTFVQPIGSADMPVVISLLNAFTGIAAALAGIVYENQVMFIGGILVGSSGIILTILMCKAMNRSLFNVIIGGFGTNMGTVKDDKDRPYQEATINDVAIMLRYAKQVALIPGYGMAVAQAQKVCRELDNLLNQFGVEVKYAIHPVAGRMPGHMNVLLAEANVPYPALLDLDDANNTFNDTQVSLVIGANDVVNPAALDDQQSPIYGMPILECLKSEHVIVLKRSMNTGYSGIDNPLFYHSKCQMLFGDAKNSIQNLIMEIKSLG